MARVELKKDQNNYDALDETWSTGRDSAGKALFENMEIEPVSRGTFTIKYLFDGQQDKYLCMQDEERKINLNAASRDLINTLLKECSVPEAEAGEIAKYICVWRGDKNPDLNPQADIYKAFKKSPFNNAEELIIILEYFYQNAGNSDYRREAKDLYVTLRDLITVYPVAAGAKVNINTASQKTIAILINSGINRLRQSGEVINATASALLNKILEYRQANVFKDADIEKSLILSGPDETDFRKIINELKGHIATESHNFRISSSGNIKNSATNYRIDCVFDRRNDKFVYWHQN